MSTAAHQDLQRYVFLKTDDPEIRARQRMIIEWGLDASPEIREELTEAARVEGHLEEARAALRSVLRARGLTLAAEDEARVEACDVLDTLRRWLNQAAIAASTIDALQ
jgi:hypothetical protein